MFEVLTQEFTAAVRTLNRLSSILRDFGAEHPGFPKNASMPAGVNTPIRKALAEFHAECVKIGAHSSANAAQAAIKALDSSANRAEIELSVHGVDCAFHKETASWFEHVLGEAKGRHYHASNSGLEVSTLAKFPGITDDLEEACKCVALGRPTASIFHLMRVMEIATRTWADALKIPRTKLNTAGTALRERPWSEIETEILTAIDRLPITTSAQVAKRQAEELAIETFAKIRSAWGNSSMHPAAKYTELEAKGVVALVQEFLAELASVV